MTRSDRPTSPLGGDQDGLALVALAEDLEEQFCSSPGKWNQTQFVDDQPAEARQIPPEVEQSFFISWLQPSALPRLHRYNAPSWFPSQGGYLGFLRGYDHLDRGRWNVAQSVLVDVDTLDDFAVLGAINNLVLRVLGLVQQQSQLFHRFHPLVVIGGGKVYRVFRELAPKNSLSKVSSDQPCSENS